MTEPRDRPECGLLPSGWRRTSPLAVVFYLGKIYEGLAKNAVQSLAPLAALVVAFQGNKLAALVGGVIVFVVATAVHAFLRYWFFRYAITDDSILIRDGVFRKRQLDIKFERVQGINTSQNIVFRLFGLVTVNLDTAGSSGQEGHLPAVESPFAAELRERIRRSPKAEIEAAGDEHRPETGARTLARLHGGDIVRIGLSSGRVFLVLALLGPLSQSLEEQSDRWVEESEVLQAVGAAHFSFVTAVGLALVVVLAVLAILLAASVVGALLRYHRYTLVADGDVLRWAAGLLTRHEQSVQTVKVQSLYVFQNFILQRFRRFRLRTRQATSGRSSKGSRFEVPICTGDLLAELGSEIFKDELEGLALDPRDSAFQRISRYYLRSRLLIAGVLPGIVAAAAFWPEMGAYGLIWLLWIPVAAVLVWMRYRRYGIAITQDGASFRRGFVGSRLTVWLHRKVQRVSVSQSPFQRRRGLATMKFYLAAGSVTVPFVDYGAAARLRDYVLYRVESSERAWH
ncbi:MAG TPA: PH domain-containing protein [Woeseiaceae bacterium]|nr:PH domain-containing protein [Woeseiaceae bacterium]